MNSVIFSMASGFINGTTFGERMFYIDGTSWFIDVNNLIMGESFVSPNQGYFSKKKNPLDWVDGKIIKVIKYYKQ